MDPIVVSLTAFLLAAALLTVTPGLDTALVLRTAATDGARNAALAALGICGGCLVWTLLVAAGVGTLLAASSRAYAALRFIGAGYLVWIGLQMLRHPRRVLVECGRPGARGGQAFARGALTNLLNPKIGVFYVSFLPQFVPHGVAVPPYLVLLGCLHAALGLIWFAVLIRAADALGGVLRRPAVIATLDRVTGGLFVLFGVALAAEARRS